MKILKTLFVIGVELYLWQLCQLYSILGVKTIYRFDLYTLHYEYVELYHSVRELPPLQSLIKEVIDNLGIDSENLKFMSSVTVYEENIEAIVVATSLNMTPTSNHIAVKYH